MERGFKISIKGMVCDRCIMIIDQQMKAQGIPVINISLGEVTTVSVLPPPDMEALKEKLAPLGFTLLENKKEKLIREVKSLVDIVYSGDYDFPQDFRFSDLVARKLNKDYKSISAEFNAPERGTIEQYIMEYRMQKIKEMLVYTDNTLSDIAFKLGFSSAAHLSRQFKSRTGLNTSHFKEIRKTKTSSQHRSDN